MYTNQINKAHHSIFFLVKLYGFTIAVNNAYDFAYCSIIKFVR